MSETKGPGTPVPWVMMDDESFGGQIHSAETFGHIADLVDGPGPDGEFIVLAVNNHDRLVKALRRVLPYAETRAEDIAEEDETSEANANAWLALEAARAVLRDVESHSNTQSNPKE